jgi:hypothetical protein
VYHGLVARQVPEYGFAMKRVDIIRDIHGLDVELAAFEEQYGLLSAVFTTVTARENWSSPAISSAGLAITKRSRSENSNIGDWLMSICANCAAVQVSVPRLWNRRPHERATG